MVDRWQRMLSGLDARTRFYFYLLAPPGPLPGSGRRRRGVQRGDTRQRKRRAFLTERVQDVTAYVAWAFDPGLSTVAAGRTGGPWWMAYVEELDGAAFRPDSRCKPGAGR